MTKAIQIVCQSPTDFSEGVFMVLCDDGTIWERVFKWSVDDKGKSIPIFQWVRVDGPPEAK
jgi:hypothetical protein